MLTQMTKTLMVVLALSLGLASPALAQADTPESLHGVRRGVGQVTAIGPSDFTVQTRTGGSRSLLVDDQTRFQDREGNALSFADLEIGAWVAGTYVIDSSGQLHARRVILLEGEPDWPDVQAVGEITAVEVENSTFRLRTREGEDLTIGVTGETRFRSRDGSLDELGDLEVGMMVFVAADDIEGALTARLVAARLPRERPDLTRAAGEVTSVNPGAGAFAIRTRQGDDRAFRVTERTRFRSRDDSVEDVSDLEEGMLAGVVAVEGNAEESEAVLVIIGNPGEHPGRPGVDVRVAGRITGIAGHSFSLLTRGGESLTFSVDGSTIFRSRDRSVNGLEDLQAGMIAVVGARELENGELTAVWVGVGKPGLQPNETR